MLTLVSNCIDRLNVYNSVAHFGECAGSEAGAAWKDILNLLYELLGKKLAYHTHTYVWTNTHLLIPYCNQSRRRKSLFENKVPPGSKCGGSLVIRNCADLGFNQPLTDTWTGGLNFEVARNQTAFIYKNTHIIHTPSLIFTHILSLLEKRLGGMWPTAYKEAFPFM